MTTAAATLTTGNDKGGAPAPAVATTQPASGASAPALPSAPTTGWWDSLKDGDTKSWAANKNFPDAEHALISYRNLETLFGADKAGRTVMLPKDENDAEGWKALSTKLGVPEKSDGYKLPLPDGVDPAFSKSAADWFHKAGVTPKQATSITEAWNGYVAAEMAKQAETDKTTSATQMAALQQEWGGDFDAKKELAQRGFREFSAKFGLDKNATLEKAEAAFGAANLTKFFAGLGSLNAESQFAGNDNKGGFGVSPRDAQIQIDTIRNKRMAGEINDYQWRTEYEPKILQLGKIINAQKAA